MVIDKKCVSCGDTYKYQPESEKIVADAFFIHSTGDQCATCICIGTPMDDATTEVSLANGIEQAKRYLGYTLDGPQTQEEGSIYQVDLTGEVTVSEIVHANGMPAFEVSVPGTY